MVRHSAEYRQDIDGLRALAILPVLLYHAGLSLFSGGFVGVDVFFVISGYLISKIIYAEIEADRFSVRQFYVRRARRLLPAFFVVSGLSFAASSVLLFPAQFERFAQSLLWSTLFVGNFFFWNQHSYFTPGAETQPLLNYWSLGVEEQFYFIFPWIVIACHRHLRGALAPVLFGLAAISLAASQGILSVSPQTSFYLLPFRAWEMLVGCLLALRGLPKPPNAAAGSFSAVAGVLMIIGASVGYSAEMSFPGLAATVPVFGAALVIWGGEKRNAVSSGIGAEPLGYVGRISYSLYLIHWPVLVFSRQLFPDAASGWSVAGVVGVSLILAAAIYHLVEVPTRTGNFWTAARMVTLSKAGMAASICLAAVVVMGQGFPGRYSLEAQRLFDFNFDHRSAYREGVCFLRPEQSFDDLATTKCLPTSGPVALLWGDSLAAHLVPGLKPFLEAKGYNFAQATAGNCRPVAGRDIPKRPHCRDFNDRVLAWIKHHRPQQIILSASWSANEDEQARLEVEVVDLQKMGANVIVIGRPPQFAKSALDQLTRKVVAGETSNPCCATVPDWILAIDKDMAGRLGKVTHYVPIMSLTCPGGRCPLASSELYPYYMDDTHLSDVGAHVAVGLMRDYLPASVSR